VEKKGSYSERQKSEIKTSEQRLLTNTYHIHTLARRFIVLISSLADTLAIDAILKGVAKATALKRPSSEVSTGLVLSCSCVECTANIKQTTENYYLVSNGDSLMTIQPIFKGTYREDWG
jgi:hypothetical protein